MEARRRRRQPEDFVFRTAYLHEAELIVAEFDRLGIAYYRAEEGPPGVRWAMPVAAAWAPGICFVVIVPAAHAKRAREVVAGLPVSKEEHPGVWQPGMTEADKRFWRRWVWLWLAVVGLGLLTSLISIFRG